MKDLIFHIGSTKTGSSAIQEFLHQNRHAMEELGILYPNIGIAGSAHHILAAAIHPSAWRMHMEVFADRDRTTVFAELVEQVRRAAESTKAETMFLSSEYLWGLFPDVVLNSLMPLFEGFRVVVLCYLRRQDEWLESTYAQSVKYGETRTFREWLLRNLDQGPGFCHYNQILRQWERHVPENMIRVRTYEAEIGTSDSITDMLNFLSIRDVSSLKFLSHKSNPSPTPTETEIVRLVNSCHASLEKKQRIRKLLMQKNAKKESHVGFHYLSADETIQLMCRYEQGNSHVARKYLKIESGQLFRHRMPHSGEWEAWPGPTIEEVMNRMISLVQ